MIDTSKLLSIRTSSKALLSREGVTNLIIIKKNVVKIDGLLKEKLVLLYFRDLEIETAAYVMNIEELSPGEKINLIVSLGMPIPISTSGHIGINSMKFLSLLICLFFIIFPS